jgi:hypothetical protein
MITYAATIDSGEAASAAESPPMRGGKMKFLYASGSRPLEGFTIKRGIGRGGFGEVYFATSDAGKEVALKHIERNLEVELRGVGQCLNLKHSNLIDLYDIRYDEQGDAWVVMEFVAGPSLKETLDRSPNGLPLAQVDYWLRGIAAGVAYLHDHGIVHRDLKPGNVFDDGGTIKIGDYGLSKFISTSRRSGQTESVGTFHYMAPEIGKGVYGKEIDIYALGIVLYELITGRTPFDGESSQEIIMKHLTADADLSGLPQPFRAIIQRALQKDPEKRFHDAAEMVALLTPASGAAHTSGLPYNVGRASRLSDPPPPDPSVIEAQAVPEAAATAPAALPPEPIATAARQAAGQFGHWWHHGPLTVPMKFVILIAGVLFATTNGHGLAAAAVVLGCLYLTYFGVRMLALSMAGYPLPPAGPLACPAPVRPLGRGTPPVRLPTLTWEEQGRMLLREKTAGDLVGELAGSMLGAAIVAGVLAVVMTTIGGQAVQHSADWRSGPVWLWLMTTIGSWLVLAVGKGCERTSGEVAPRRFILLIAGLVFGGLAFLASDYLMVTFEQPHSLRHGPFRWLYRGDMPAGALFLAYFGAVFFTLRWWKQTDPLRSSRLRVAPVLLAVMVAWLWQLAFPFPQPWGFMLVAGISIATQFSAPWLSKEQRTAAMVRRQQMVV